MNRVYVYHDHLHTISDTVNIVRIEETDFYDNIETTREALRARRLQGIKTNSNTNGDTKKITLYHAMLGRYIGGGIAFIDTICDSKWGFGVTSDLSGTLRSIDDDVLYDFFIFSHELVRVFYRFERTVVIHFHLIVLNTHPVKIFYSRGTAWVQVRRRSVVMILGVFSSLTL